MMADTEIEDEYQTIATLSRAEVKVKGSRFIGESFLVVTAEEANDRLQHVISREHAATHHCYAWQGGIPAERRYKYSDDGEPRGTAGKPIFDIISGHQLTNTLVVVTRYYGGTKLGTGGLVRAYSDTAKDVLAASGSETHYIMAGYRMKLPFPLYNNWMTKMQSLGVQVEESEYSDIVRLQVRIRRSRKHLLEDSFRELTSGKGELVEIDC
jgi:uncharacterized YigZ family protein